jgi:iron complex transport system ATP-binding protein
MTPLVQLTDITVSYGGRPVVDRVSLTVDAGGWLAILGPNGAGKSTLLRVLVGERPDAGSALVDGHDMATTRGRHRAQLVAYVPQAPTFPPGMSVFDYVLLGRTPYMGPLAAESREDIAEVWDALSDLDLTAFVDRDVATLSGGETQRVALARVLAQRAPVLVLDEATASLDVARQHRVLELIDSIRVDRRLAVIAAIHDLTAAAQFADHVAVMDEGRLRATGSPASVLTEQLLRDVYEPSVRVLDVDGSTVIVSMRPNAPISADSGVERRTDSERDGTADEAEGEVLDS